MSSLARLLGYGGFYLFGAPDRSACDVLSFAGDRVFRASRFRARFGRGVTAFADGAGRALVDVTRSTRSERRMVVRSASGRQVGAFEERSLVERRLEIERADRHVLFGVTPFQLVTGDYAVTRAAVMKRVAMVQTVWDYSGVSSLVYESQSLSADERGLLLAVAVCMQLATPAVISRAS